MEWREEIGWKGVHPIYRATRGKERLLFPIFNGDGFSKKKIGALAEKLGRVKARQMFR